jgi:hypothetical protein
MKWGRVAARNAEPAIRTTAAQAISDRHPGAATMSPARNTPFPRLIAGRSRQVLPGGSSAAVRPFMTCRRRQVSRSRQPAVVVTPAHQFPRGVVLSSERRAALLGWAEDVDGLVIEDDYDSELRYDRGAVGALQGLAPERVCLIGSMSKRLAPALRLGWVLSPSWLTGALAYEKALADSSAPGLGRLALADFIARGELDR